MQSHIRKVYACLVVTCHLHFWQNDRGLLRATAITHGCSKILDIAGYSSRMVDPRYTIYQVIVHRSHDLCHILGVHLAHMAVPRHTDDPWHMLKGIC